MPITSNRKPLHARSSVSALPGVGPKLAAKFTELNISEVKDLWFYLPSRYQDRTRITPIGAAHDMSDVVIEGEVVLANVSMGRRRSLLVKLQDGSGTITLRFFHFSRAQQTQLSKGIRLRCYGQIRRGPVGFEMIHPEYRRVDLSEPMEEALTPIYPTVAGIGQATWRKACHAALEVLAHSEPEELLPQSIDNRISLSAAITLLHRPPADVALSALADKRHPAQERLALEELVAHRVSLNLLRSQQTELPAPRLVPKPDTLKQFLEAQPFEPTAAQLRVIEEIGQDLCEPTPMLRLLQGDVGAGKTLVAASVALQAIHNGYQVAVMAPTELLAEQHLRNFQQWFQDQHQSAW